LFPAACQLLVVGLLLGCSGQDFQANLHALLEKQRLAAQLQQSLLAASDAANKSLLAPDEAAASQQAAAAKAAFEAGAGQLQSLSALIEKGNNPKEIEAVKPVVADFKELDAAYAALHGLVARNTNVRAARLSRHEAAQAVERLRQALAPILAAPDCAAAAQALRAIAAAQAILILHPLHIDERSAAGMDALEAAMNQDDRDARTALAGLADLAAPSGDGAAQAQAAKAAQDAYEAFWTVHAAIIGLSRENSNIEAIALTMGRKQLLQAKILADLTTLAAVIDEKQFTATR
jgi:GH24 family phage-related lysozyme (muramidase)